MEILLDNLLAACSGEIRGSTAGRTIGKVEYDSRKADPLTLFFCLPGARADGHDYAPSAYEAGCRAFVVERFLPLPEDAVQFRVTDAREALAYISARFYGDPA
ncbi:MAG: UDP-N-acetylmuramoyl-L-alanyl-D-glutamate--2,6-diaminopimelate ligase, partial [Clostridia bacterium]|nr:UDP-N-acetylmuramoyl-L-alanyl-D-glutamate--2,6-diaminopimelate ligase [Clostridia bacterium]